MAPFEYAVFTEGDSEEMAGLLGAAFARHDPPAVAVGLTEAEFREFVGLLCPHAAKEGLTVVARSAATGEMAGALVAEDSSSPMPSGMERLYLSRRSM